MTRIELPEIIPDRQNESLDTDDEEHHEQPSVDEAATNSQSKFSTSVDCNIIYCLLNFTISEFC